MKKLTLLAIFIILLGNALFSQNAKAVPKNAKLVFENSEIKVFKKGRAYYGEDSNGKPVRVTLAKSADSGNKNKVNQKKAGGEVTLPCSATRDSNGAYSFHPCKN